LKAADAALFRAKAMGRSQLSVFTPELLKAAAAKFTMEQGLRRAIERGEFELVFQPEISVETLKTALVEALIRWRTPDGSLLLPGDFLAVAEESGLIWKSVNGWCDPLSRRRHVGITAHGRTFALPSTSYLGNSSTLVLLNGYATCCRCIACRVVVSRSS